MSKTLRRKMGRLCQAGSQKRHTPPTALEKGALAIAATVALVATLPTTASAASPLPRLVVKNYPAFTHDGHSLTTAVASVLEGNRVEAVHTALALFVATGQQIDHLITIDPSQSKGWISNSHGLVFGEFDLATGKGGLSSGYDSYGTPPGAHLVYDSVEAEYQQILKSRIPRPRTAEINGSTAYVTSAVLALKGLEQRNLSSAARNVYIHGTNVLSSLGEGAKSGGCIRVSPETAYTLVRFAQSGVTGVYVLDRPWIGRPD